jgi:excisionase family DNA binding protein
MSIESKDGKRDDRARQGIGKLPRLLTIGEVAEYLGVTERHVRRLVAERRIPFVKWGHLLRFDQEEIAAWIDAARRPVGRDGQAGRAS